MLGVDHNPVLVPTRMQLADAPPLPSGALRAEAVPNAQKHQPLPLFRILLPIVMMVAVGAVMALMLLSGRAMGPMMLVFPLMMAFGLIAMFQPQEQQSDIDETRRVYLRHLDALTKRARANAVKQRAHFSYLHPEPAMLLTGVDSARVWERGAGTAESLQVRLGTGAMALCTPVEVDDPGSPEDLDPVCAVSLRRAVAAVGTVPGMPIVVQLGAFPAVTLAGPRAHDVASAVVAQLAFFHGPETVGLELEHAAMPWAKWLPHTREPERAQFRVVVAQARRGADDAAFAPAHATADCVITVDEDPDAFVSEHAFHVVCAEELAAVTESGREYLGVPDPFSAEEAALIARHLAFYRRPTGTSSARKTGGDLLAMLGIDDVDALDAAAMWPGREGTRQRLTVPIGATPEGEPVYLDLKEAAHGGMGPHGLCIGATGSGKSELLKSLVAALVATHSPEEINLVLVDFKGGATFLGCEGLPHTAAVITNLEDEAVLVERMYDAISGEMHRRQELLRTAGNYANITDYTAARLRGEALDPLPALVIIVDEFSELLTQHPHFAELFVAVGRLGRSLGVHLLLASQRLEEGKLRGLDSHLSYRIGLKTFSAGESRQVLGVPDAYELPGEPGSGFLKAGSPDLVRFRASYVSGPLTRRVAARGSAEAPAVRPFHGWETAAAEAEAVDTVDTVETVETSTTFAAIVDKAGELAAADGMRAHQVWLPPLPDTLALHTVSSDVPKAAPLTAPVGLIDLPYRQRQDPLLIDLGTAGGHIAIAGGPQTGKSAALRTIAAALALAHTTDQLAIYGIDAGSGGLDDLERLPHVAGIALRTDEERVRRVVDEVVELLDAGEGQRGVEKHTLLLLDGWHTLCAPDSKFEDLKEPLARIASEGPAAGVHLVVTTQRWNAIRPNVRDLIGTRYELHLTEPMDSLIDRKLQQKLPAKPGHGLTPDGTHLLFAHANAQDLAHIAATAAGQQPVPKLKVLPAHVRTAELLSEQPHELPIGIGGPRLAPLHSQSGHLLAIGAGGAGKSTVIASAITAIEAMGRAEARMVICDPRRAHLGRAAEEMTAAYAASSTAIAEALRALVTTMRERLPGAEVTPAQLAERSWWSGPDIYLVIDDLELVGEEHLREVIALLPHARDIGLHVVAARKFGGVARAMFGGFLGALKDTHPDVLIMDGTREEGALFGVKPKPQAPGRATLVQAGSVQGTVQLCAPYEEGASL